MGWAVCLLAVGQDQCAIARARDLIPASLVNAGRGKLAEMSRLVDKIAAALILPASAGNSARAEKHPRKNCGALEDGGARELTGSMKKMLLSRNRGG
jgi:hypothetical protein